MDRPGTGDWQGSDPARRVEPSSAAPDGAVPEQGPPTERWTPPSYGDERPTEAWTPPARQDPPRRPTWDPQTGRLERPQPPEQLVSSAGRTVSPATPAAQEPAAGEPALDGDRDGHGARAGEAAADAAARRPLESRAAYERRMGAERVTAARPAIEAVPVQVRKLRRGRLVVRKINPWSVLRFSLVFYFCMLLIVLLGTALVFGTMKAFGVVDNAERVLANLNINVDINGGTIFRWFFLAGLAGTLVASAVTVFMSFLYNLIADVVGGIEMLVTEREQQAESREQG